ncbi:hypothetical protein GVAV_000356 [Gurleya vavrai]
MPYRISDFVDEILGKTDIDKNTYSFNKIIPSSITNPDTDFSFKKVKIPKPEIFEPEIWSDEVIPHSRLIKRFEKTKHKSRINIKLHESQSIEFFNTDPNTIAKELTNVDIEFLLGISPSELLDYDGKPINISKCDGLRSFDKKNQMLTNLVHKEVINNEENIKYFIKLAQNLASIKNYNSLSCITVALKKIKLQAKYFEKIEDLDKSISDYFNMRKIIEESHEEYIIPLSIILKDIEEANSNKESEIAAKRFCFIVEYLVNIEKFKKYKIKAKYEHFLKWKIVNAEKKNINIIEKEKKVEIGSIFLFL